MHQITFAHVDLRAVYQWLFIQGDWQCWKGKGLVAKREAVPDHSEG